VFSAVTGLSVINLKGLVLSVWERLSSRDLTIADLERLPFVAGKPLPREVDVKLMTLDLMFNMSAAAVLKSGQFDRRRKLNGVNLQFSCSVLKSGIVGFRIAQSN
jgi:hypothetical protein